MGAKLAVLAFIGCLPSASCTRPPHLIIPDPLGAQRESLTAIIGAHPLPPNQNIAAVTLGRTDALSYHLVQIRDRERPHVHATHDLTVTLLRGSGHLHVGDSAFALRAGDVAVVAHGTLHYFVNSESAPAAAFVTFAPPYDGTDLVPAKP